MIFWLILNLISSISFISINSICLIHTNFMAAHPHPRKFHAGNRTHISEISLTFLTLKLKSSAAVKQRRSRCHCRIRDRAIAQKGTSEDARTAQLA